jgi:hypothetical protein
MEKQSTSTSSPTTSESSTYSIHDPPGYINPSLQDMLLTDITAEELLKIAERLGVDYLGPATEFPSSFPVDGKIHGNNKRLMVSLSCRREGNNSQSPSTSSFSSILALQTLFCQTKQWRHWLESLDAILARRWMSCFIRIMSSLAIYLLMTNIFRM